MATILKRSGSVPLPVIQSTVPAPGADKFWDLETHGVTQGALALWAACPMKANLKLRQGLNPVSFSGGSGMGRSALAFGDVFHRALDLIYTKGTVDLFGMDGFIDKGMDAMFAADTAKLKKDLMPEVAHGDLEFIYGQARLMVHAYYDQWKSDLADFDWVDLERVFNVPYSMCTEKIELTGGDPAESMVHIPIRGKMDGVFRAKDGKLWLFETKTKSRIDDNIIPERLNYDLQVMLYMWAMRKVYGENPAGVIYNIVRRPQLRQGVKETTEQFFERTRADVKARPLEHFVRYTGSILPEELDEWIANDLDPIMESFYNWSQGTANYRNSGSCINFMQPCEYMQTCSRGTTEGLKRREVMFPELEPVADVILADS